MATSLTNSPVTRKLDYEIDGRDVLVTMETVSLDATSIDDHLSIRLKGQRSGWYLSLRELARFAVLHPRSKNKDFLLKISADARDIEAWAKEYEKVQNKKTED